MEGVLGDVKVWDFIPRYCVYHWVVLGMDLHVRTRWSRALIVTIGVVDMVCYSDLEN